jgi:hypothetical protein
MSAINDALRRASSAAKSNPGVFTAPPALPPMDVPPPPVAPLPPPVATLPPIITAPAEQLPVPPLCVDSGKKRSKVPLMLGTLLVFCLLGVGAACLFGKKYFVAQAREKLQRTEEKITSDKDHVATLFADSKTVAQAATSNVPSNPILPKPQPSVVRVPDSTQMLASVVSTSAPAPVPAPVVVPRAPVHFPPLRLQSIFFRPANPCVMINGKTLFVDDEINGVTVADIQPASVTLVLSGQTNVLTLR